MPGNDNHPPVPWWLWPSCLSLDAPAIALAWQALFARSAGVELNIGERAALAIAVWIIYAADRVLDGRRLGVHPGTAVRHRFARRHTRLITIAIAIAVVAETGIVLTRLSSQIVAGGIFLGGLTALYFVWNHLAGTRWGRGWAKEIVVSVGFAGGAGLVALLEAPSFQLIAGVIAFAGLCFVNCLLIAAVERERDLERGERSLASGFPAAAIFARGLAALICVVTTIGLFQAEAFHPVLWCLLASALLLGGVGIAPRMRAVDATAVWADFVLLTPLVALAAGAI